MRAAADGRGDVGIGAAWLSVTPAFGSAADGAPGALTLRAAPGALAPGDYDGFVRVQYSGAATNGTGTAAGILVHEVDLLGPYASAQDATGLMLVHGYVKESVVIGLDENGKADLKHVIFG